VARLIKSQDLATKQKPATRTCPECQGSGESTHKKDLAKDDDGNVYSLRACHTCHGNGKINEN
jgi:DnaJ-class molecular chaperone